MFKKLICLLVSILLAINICPVSSLANTVGTVLLEESFNFQAADTGADIGGWNGWTEECGNLNQYTLDSSHTLATEPETTNGVGAFYRSSSNNSSAAFMNVKSLTTTQSGGKVSVKLSLKRTNAAAKLFLFRFYDTAGKSMGFVIDLAASRIYTENAGTFPNYYFPGITSNTSSPLNVWQTLEWVFDFENGKFDCFYQVEGSERGQIADDYSIVSTNNGSIAKVSVGTQRNANGSGALFYLDDLMITCVQAPVTDEDACNLTYDFYAEKFAQPLTESVELSAEGLYNATVNWESSDESVITTEGRITRLFGEDSTATLSATISRGEHSITREYTVTVKGVNEYIEPTADIMESVAAGYSFSQISDESIYAVSENLTLPDYYDKLAASAIGGVNVSWSSDNASVIADDGTVTRGESEAKASLTATFTSVRDSSLTAEKTFDITLLPAGTVCYYETFDTPISSEGQNLDGWNGWSMNYGDPNVYTMDSYFTLASEEDGDGNKVSSFLRPTGSSNSMYVTASKTLPSVIDGGTVSLRFRINRKSSAARLFILQFTDDASHTMEFNVDLANSRIYSNNNTPSFGTIRFPGLTTNTSSPVNMWQHIELVLKLDEQKFDCYYGGTMIGENLPIISTNNGKISKITLLTHRTENSGGNALFYVDDIVMTKTAEKISDEEACTLTSQMLETMLSQPLTEDVELSQEGLYKSVVSWTSSDSSVITPEGKITRLYREDKTATLTATITHGEYSKTYEYTVTVKGVDEYITPTASIMQDVAEGFKFSEISEESIYAVSKDLTLPGAYDKLAASAIGGVSVEWRSSNPSVLSDAGVVQRAASATSVTLTAKFTAVRDTSISVEKDFVITLLPAGTVRYYETFDTPESTPGQSLDGWNGWSMSYGDFNAYVMDSYFTVESEADGDGNKVSSFLRPTCGNNSMYVTASNTLDTAIDGGTVSLRFRINRKNSAAKLFILQFTDNASHTMEFNIDLANSRIYSNNNTPSFGTIRFPGLTANTASPVNTWQNIELILKLDDQKFDCYYDGVMIGENLPMISANNGTLSKLTLLTHRTSNTGGNAQFYVDDIIMTQTVEKIADDAACDVVAERLYEKYNGRVLEGDLELESKSDYKTTVVWETPDTDYSFIRENVLVVTRDNEDHPFEIKGKIYRNQTYTEVVIPMSVKALDGILAPTQEKVQTLADHFDFSQISDEKCVTVTQDLNLITEYFKGEAAAFGGADVLWESSRPHVIAPDGSVVSYQYDTPVVLTATFSARNNPDIKAQKQFSVTVLSEGEIFMSENFDDAQITDMNETISYNGWSLSRGDMTHIAAADAQIEFDESNPNNKYLHVTRTVKNGSSPPYAAYQLVQKSFDTQITEGVLVFSLRFMVTNSTSRVSMIIHDTYGTSAGTSIQISQYYAGGKKLDEPLVFNRWYTATVVLEMNTGGSGSHSYDFFLDHKKVYSDGFKTTNNYPLRAFSVYSERNSDGPNASWFVDDILIRYSKMNYERDVNEAYNALDIDLSGLAEGKIELPSVGECAAAVKWFSSDENVISSSGVVYRSNQSKTVTLTAQILRGDTKREKTFTVTVPAGSGIGSVFEISGMNISEGSITVMNDTGAANAVLIILKYDRGTLVAARCVELPDESGSSNISFEPVQTDSSNYSYCRAYVWDVDKNAIVSNMLYQ